MENVAVPELKSLTWDTVENNTVNVTLKKVREFTSPRVHSHLDGLLVHRSVTPQQNVAGTELYTWVKGDKVE